MLRLRSAYKDILLQQYNICIYQDEIDHARAEIEVENDKQIVASSYEELIKAKKESVGLQLEAAYRQRLAEAHQQVYFESISAIVFFF